METGSLLEVTGRGAILAEEVLAFELLLECGHLFNKKIQ